MPTYKPDEIRAVQLANRVPDFGDPRLTYGWIDTDQLIYVDGDPIYALARGRQGRALSDEELYQAHLQNLAEITRQTEAMKEEQQQRLIDITTTLTGAEAEALAQFVKRVQYTDIERRAEGADDAYIMQDALVKIGRALAEKGYAPR